MTTYQIINLTISAIGLTGLFPMVIAYIVKANKKEKALAKGIQALLRAQMISDYNKWSDRGYAPIYAKDNLENCWEQYEALGCNGVIAKIHESFMNLPTEVKKNDQVQRMD